MSKGVQTTQSLVPRHPLDKLAAWQLACIFLVITAIWLCEVLDFPALFCGANESPVDWTSASITSGFVLLFGLAATLPVHLHRRRSSIDSVTICSYCRRVQVDQKNWDQIETFFSKKSAATYSHGVCPECCTKVMSAYRSGKKDAGAREPLPTELLV